MIVTVGAGRELGAADLEAVANAVRQAKPVGFPTDTVYGIGANGQIKAAVRKIYQIKGREALKPLPILIDSIDAARRWVEWTPVAQALASRFWPGALTLVLKPTREGRLLTFQEFPTLAVRVPAHPIALQILRAAGVPMATSSANLSGRPAMASGAEVAKAFGDQLEFVVDAGPVGGKESSVVDATSAAPRVLREGSLSRRQILEVPVG
jgi:L-threonylcarbamoyladenylate synthase